MPALRILGLLSFINFLVFNTIVYGQKNKGKTEIVEIGTSYGTILVWLYDETPLHKENFLKLAKEGFYSGTTFHRVIKNFVIQGGDPNTKDDNPANDGEGGPGYTIPAEFNSKFKHVYGTVAAARMGDNENPERKSSGSQFYIVINQKGTPHLDGTYTIFGKVITGMEVAEKIASQPTSDKNRPLGDIKMTVKVIKIKVRDLEKKYNFAP